MPDPQLSLEAVLTSVNRAKGLPNPLYVDARTAEQERQRVFFDHWAAIGHGKDIPEAGDAMPIDFLGEPLLALRTRDGIEVFENVCRHRGMMLVQTKTKLRGAIRCPYHSWCYDLSGKLLSTPQVGGVGTHSHPDIDRGALGLTRVRSFLWRDILFVNVSGTAPAFEEVHRDLMARWREFEGPLYPGSAESSFSLSVRCNWKLAVENYLESYHLPTVHARLNSYSPLSEHYNIAEYGKFAGQGTRTYRPTLDDAGRRFADVPGLSAQWDTGAEYLGLFPNVLLGVHRDHAFSIVLEPHGMESTTERVEIYYASPDMQGAEYAGLRAKNAGLWRAVFEEDVGVVEGMQRGRHALHFDGGKLSPVMDEPTHVFHHWVASQLQAGSRPQAASQAQATSQPTPPS
ncbi:MAG: aromatic ring-hydroxylating dioxygenase subunit alpha [Steroidobacteraceae bacterium]